ncbi:Protein of unknown function DUF241, plant [Cynara cardunculus var. scolymus]|uniref:Uncharacterized protein n=1 Tax=Cynara cardunculus var. scolymus TaxID=59895 RepID=A0A118K310_CYNCS|nr:Protein of unknown function DUF241, plant [Cynara cardunculus var. scolymus]
MSSSSSNFESLRDLHDSVNNLLRSPDFKRVLSHHKQDQKWVQMASDSSLKMLDSCGTTKDILCHVKGHIQDLQSRFRRVSLGETEMKLSEYPKVKFTRANSLSPWEDCDAQALQSAIERLEAVESAMEDLEVELGCIFQRLMRTRVLLLNILTN